MSAPLIEKRTIIFFRFILSPMTVKEEPSDAVVPAMRDVSNICLEKNERIANREKDDTLEPEALLKTVVDDDVVRAVEAAETVILTNVDELLSQSNDTTGTDLSDGEYDDMSVMTGMTSMGGGEELEALQRELEGANLQTFLRDKNTKRIKGLDRAPGMGKSRPARRRRLLRALRAEGKIPPKSNPSNQSLEQIAEDEPSSNSSSLQKALQQKQLQETSPKPKNQRRSKPNYSNCRDSDDTTKYRTPKSNHRRGPKQNYHKGNNHSHHNRYSQPYNNMPTAVSLHSTPHHHQAHYYNTASPTAPTHHYHPPYLQNYYPPNTHHMTPPHNQHHSHTHHNHPHPYNPTPYTPYPNSSPYQNHSSHHKPRSNDNTISARSHNHANLTQPRPGDKVSS